MNAKKEGAANTASQEAKQAIKELAKVQKEAAQAREEAARLGGQLDTYKEQVAALMARIAPSEAKPTKEKKSAE